jgi:glycosyltransferase involved in cell wall biosynthesis
VPRKGYDVLIAALATLADLPWQLTIVGDPTRSADTTTALIHAVQLAGLTEKVSLAGVLSDDDLADEYTHADAFVTASHFEGYGMAVTTAMMCGLPVIATAGGALTQTVGDTGLLVPPGNIDALAAGLRQAIVDPELRAKLRGASLARAEELPTWSDTASDFAGAIEGLA